MVHQLSPGNEILFVGFYWFHRRQRSAGAKDGIERTQFRQQIAGGVVVIGRDQCLIAAHQFLSDSRLGNMLVSSFLLGDGRSPE